MLRPPPPTARQKSRRGAPFCSRSRRPPTLEELILAIARSSNGFDENSFRALRAMCKKSAGILKSCHEIVCKQLCRSSPNRKLNLIRVLNEFSHRSAAFRQWTIDCMEEIIEEALIKPFEARNSKTTTKRLCSLTAEMFLRLRDQFEDCRARIVLMENHLKQARNIDLTALCAREAINEDRPESLIDDKSSAIEELLRGTDAICQQIKEALHCMYPKLEELMPAKDATQSGGQLSRVKGDSDDDSDGEFVDVPESNDVDMRLHGFHARSQLIVRVDEPVEPAVTAVLEDLCKEASKSYLPQLLKYAEDFTCGDKWNMLLRSSVARLQSLLKECQRSIGRQATGSYTAQV